MANHPSALKRMRQNRKRRLRNRMMRSEVKSQVKKLMAALDGQKIDDAQQLLRRTMAILHKSASKGVYHPNKASRHISRLSRKVSALAAG
ncbi:MAG: 30S ribosomal protein S20 [Thermodesulfobacteriota bacterium]